MVKCQSFITKMSTFLLGIGAMHIFYWKMCMFPSRHGLGYYWIVKVFYLDWRGFSSIAKFLFKWFKFTLKPPYTIAHGHLLLAIWDTSHLNPFVKFGLKTA